MSAQSNSTTFLIEAESLDILDPGIVSSLLEVGGNEFLLSLLETFTNEAEQLTNEMASAFEQSDLQRFDQAIHTLKGSAASIGTNRLYRMAAHLNDVSRKGQWPQEKEWLSWLSSTINLTIKTYRDMLYPLPGQS